MIELLEVFRRITIHLKTHNIQKFRAKQLIDYIYHRYIFDFEDMTLSKRLASMVKDNCVISLPH